MWIADGWKDYQVIDCSQGEKLERWGKYVLLRPDPQVIWDTPKKNKNWKKLNGHYHRSKKGGGEWEYRNAYGIEPARPFIEAVTSIDTMEVSGTVLNTADLEPIKGIQVGLHKNLNDSAFTKLPFDRVSRTDSRGHFSIRGVAPGKYRIYALMDGNQNYLFDSKTEAIAFSDSIIIPSMMPATRQDTIWKDTCRLDISSKTSPVVTSLSLRAVNLSASFSTRGIPASVN